jgi:hypothetical protein
LNVSSVNFLEDAREANLVTRIHVHFGREIAQDPIRIQLQGDDELGSVAKIEGEEQNEG